MRELALFAGGGGGILGSIICGFDTIAAVEIVPEARGVLLRRQKDGFLPKFPIWDDVRTFNGIPWSGEIDVITGGFPCQDISSAGKGVGITGSSSSLFFEMLRIIGEVRPNFVIAENSPHLRTKGLGAVLHGLAGLGYDAKWGVLGAGHVGANHHRKRMWVVAADSTREQVGAGGQPRGHASMGSHGGMVANTYNSGIKRSGSRHVSGGTPSPEPCAESEVNSSTARRNTSYPNSKSVREQQGRIVEKGEISPEFGVSNWWSIPRFARVDDGGSNRVDIEQAIASLEMEGVEEKPRDRNARVVMTGNMQVPAVAALAWSILTS